MKGKKNGLTREQAMELYRDLQRNMALLLQRQKMEVAGSKREETKTAGIPKAYTRANAARNSAGDSVPPANKTLRRPLNERVNRGHYAAMGCLIFFAAAKVVFSAMESAGFATATPAQASYAGTAARAAKSVVEYPGPQTAFSREEMTILTALDSRRVELEERSRRIDQREGELDKRDREFAARQTQLKEMTEALKADREKNDKKRNNQLDQLANVYGSMDPKEAAALIAQLDVTIALTLLERMPEKRIAQILALMNPERALTITKMLSSRALS